MFDIVFIKFHLKKFGGLEKYSSKIINSFLERDYNIALLTTTKPSDEVLLKKNLNIILLRPLKIFKFLQLKLFDKKCQKWLKNHKPKIIFSLDRSSIYTHIRLGTGLHLSFLKKRKLIENKLKTNLNKLNPLNKIILNIEKKGLQQKNLKKIITNSNMVKQELMDIYNIPSKKIDTVHNGVEYDELEKHFKTWEKEKNIFINKLKLKKTDFHFIFIGNDYKRKGLVFLLKALSIIKNESFHLSIIGKEKNIKKFIKITKALGLEEKVSFFGKRNDIIKFYQMADVLVLPTLYDPFSNVVIEAIAMGVFVITSKFNGAKEIITKKNGIIVDILDPEAFSENLKKALNMRKEFNNSIEIRKTVKNLNFSKQLNLLIEKIKY